MEQQTCSKTHKYFLCDPSLLLFHVIPLIQREPSHLLRAPIGPCVSRSRHVFERTRSLWLKTSNREMCHGFPCHEKLLEDLARPILSTNFEPILLLLKIDQLQHHDSLRFDTVWKHPHSTDLTGHSRCHISTSPLGASPSRGSVQLFGLPIAKQM